jgi:hypothetical protein
MPATEQPLMRSHSEIEPGGGAPRAKRRSALSSGLLRGRRAASPARDDAAQKTADAEASSSCADRVAALLAKAGYGFEPVPSTAPPKRG